MNKLLIALAVAAAIAVLAWISNNDYEDAKAQDKEYCEMVGINKKTQGEYGWPDFNGTYDKMCK